ncbi:MAG: ABC transporter ATP-binding protein [Candidatus Zixiibacteriota bacterium]|nr:MAG: ABC transporter ATP-binding protein [candidate division Zixibacteria bacterium]
MLSAKDIHREFRTASAVLHVLKGVNLEISSRETVAVTGASGVGKSTLLHILGGLDRPTRGEVRIKGVTLSNQSEKSLAMFRNERVGFVFQFHYLLEDFDARENTMIPMLVAGKRKSEAAGKAELLLGMVGLKDRMEHRPNQLSGGEQQRLAVARALANDPEIVLADEPSGNLDTATGRKLHELLFELNASQGVTFLIATHNQELAGSCARKMSIVDGLIVENEIAR